MVSQVSPVGNAVQQETAAKGPGTEEQFVIFKIAGEEYASPILDVKEIIKSTEITQVPNAPRYVEGIINLRGKVIVVINLMRKFDLEVAAQTTHIIIAQVEEELFGLVVDEVVEVLRTSTSNIKDTPRLMAGKIHSDLIKNVLILNERMVMLLDMPAILNSENLDNLQNLAQSVKKPVEQSKLKAKTEDATQKVHTYMGQMQDDALQEDHERETKKSSKKKNSKKK